ncbi:MAG: hypothetical protein ACKOGE_05990 [Actinomycetota bacterium]
MMWTSGRSGSPLRSAAGTGARATTKVRSTRLGAPLTGALLAPASGRGLVDELSSSGDVVGGTVALGALPASTPAATGSLPTGARLIDSGVDGTGTVTALATMPDGSLAVFTRAPGAVWSGAATVPGTVGGAGLIASPNAFPAGSGATVAFAVDQAGDAAVAYGTKVDSSTGTISVAGTQFAIAVSQRSGTGGTFGAPIIARGPANGSGAQFDGLNATVAISPAVVVVGGSGNPVAARNPENIVAIIAASAAPGAQFPAASAVNVLGSTENWSTQGMTSAANNAGMGAVAIWGTGAQGDSEDLGVTTAITPGGTWSSEVNLAGANSTEGGYTGVSIEPTNSGFIAAWSASLTNDVVYPKPRYPIGVAAFQ